MGMLGSMNDARVIHLFLIYLKATWGNLFSDRNLHDGIKPSMIENKGYPLLLWLMVPHKQTRARHSILEALHNKQLSYAQVIIGNSFNIFKKMC
jgi:hypothetical protein